MSAARYIPEIVRQFPEENPEDFVMMIEILAEERARALETDLSDIIYDYAATIICTIFEPVKLQNYIDGIRILRRSYTGIAASSQLQDRYRNFMTSTLLRAATPQEAILAGIDALFS